MKRRNAKHIVTGILATVSLLLGLVGTEVTATAAPAAKSGGSITIATIGSEYLSMDPTLSPNVGSEQMYFDAIYGGLFYQTPDQGIGMGLAKSYKFSNGDKTLTITLRPGLKFTDGTPLDAQAVKYNFIRDRQPATEHAGNVAPFKYVTSVTTQGRNKLLLHSSIPDPAMIQGFIPSGVNFPASPTAIKAEGPNGYGQKPVGAGPFMVESYDPSVKLVLKKNPGYWDKGHPYLDSITFLNVDSDQSALAALQTGTAQMVVGIATPSLIDQARSQFNVHALPGPNVTTLEFNTYKPPFNNLTAREAVTYALNPQQLLETNSKSFGQVVKGIEGPGNAFYEKGAVPGYRGYNLAKAKQLVQKLGGLKMEIISGTTPNDTILLDSLQNELAQAGISVTLKQQPLSTSDQDQKTGNWQSIIGSTGGADPDVGESSLVERFLGGAPYSCCKDKALDVMIQQTLGAPTRAGRKKVIDKIAGYVMKRAYIVPLYAVPQVLIADKSIKGLTVAAGQDAINITENWPDISVTS